jgi:hypothetical protein
MAIKNGPNDPDEPRGGPLTLRRMFDTNVFTPSMMYELGELVSGACGPREGGALLSP